MARGRTPGDYKTDLYFLPAHITVDVPNNLFAEANLKWVAAVAGTPRTPGRVTHRHAVGIDATGHRARVIVPDVTADLWTGAATTWTFIDNNGGAQTATVTGLVGEAGTV